MRTGASSWRCIGMPESLRNQSRILWRAASYSVQPLADYVLAMVKMAELYERTVMLLSSFCELDPEEVEGRLRWLCARSVASPLEVCRYYVGRADLFIQASEDWNDA